MTKRKMITVALTLIVGGTAGFAIARFTPDTAAPVAGTATPAPSQAGQPARKPLFYRAPMNPAVTSPVPAKDAMGMDYVPVYADDTKGPAGTVSIDPVTVQNIGVRTTTARRRLLRHTVRAPGRVTYDEEHMARLHPKTSGWIDKLYVSRTGDMVARGTVLLGIYAPELVSSQQEYLLALRNFDVLKNAPEADIRDNARRLISDARKRLELLDMPEHQIKALEKTRNVRRTVHIRSPFSGVVLKIGARQGEHVSPASEIFRIADLSTVWVYVDVYEHELPWVRVGDTASLTIQALAGRRFEGRVAYIYPYLEPQTRTARVRLEFDNPDQVLKPESFANVTLHSGRAVDAVVVPEEAIVRSGRKARIFVRREHGKFEPRTVKLGLDADGFVQVLDGINAGEEVVVSSQFLLDSESRLREAVTKMLDRGNIDAAMDRSGMSIPNSQNQETGRD